MKSCVVKKNQLNVIDMLLKQKWDFGLPCDFHVVAVGSINLTLSVRFGSEEKG